MYSTTLRATITHWKLIIADFAGVYAGASLAWKVCGPILRRQTGSSYSILTITVLWWDLGGGLRLLRPRNTVMDGFYQTDELHAPIMLPMAKAAFRRAVAHAFLV